MDSRGCDCEQRGQKFTAVSHFIHPIKKLPLYCTQRDVGTESDCGAERGVPATIIDLDTIMTLVYTFIAIVVLIVITVSVLYWR
jgi:hypothetical protein